VRILQLHLVSSTLFCARKFAVIFSVASASSTSQSVRLKELGNAAFKSRRFEKACRIYSQAIAMNPENHLLYANRAAARMGLEQFRHTCSLTILVARLRYLNVSSERRFIY
jgi:hypothetical protein